MLTRKHFKKLAEIVRKQHDVFGYHVAYDIYSDFANMCIEENPRFNKTRFWEECFPDEPVPSL